MEARFNVVFEGKVLDGHKIETVQAEIARLLNSSIDKILSVWGTPIVVKKQVDEITANRVKDKLNSIGASCRLQPLQEQASFAPQSSFASTPYLTNLEVSKLRHEKERRYFIIAATIGAMVWLGLVLLLHVKLLFFFLPIALILWLSQQFFKAFIFGNSIRVSETQYNDINSMVKEISASLGLTSIPYIFLVNGNGIVNAMALRFISARYVILFSSMVDLMLKRHEDNELRMVIAHELGHHAAGHVSLWKTILLLPALCIPSLGMAYRRACELTADRIGFAATGDLEASKRALISIASGSESLASTVNIHAFIQQEAEIPRLFAYFNEMFSSHPRMTKRIIALDTYTMM